MATQGIVFNNVLGRIALTARVDNKHTVLMKMRTLRKASMLAEAGQLRISKRARLYANYQFPCISSHNFVCVSAHVLMTYLVAHCRCTETRDWCKNRQFSYLLRKYSWRPVYKRTTSLSVCHKSVPGKNFCCNGWILFKFGTQYSRNIEGVSSITFMHATCAEPPQSPKRVDPFLLGALPKKSQELNVSPPLRGGDIIT